MDRIEIEGLRLLTVVGVPEHERQALQPVVIDLVLHADLGDAGASDDLADTADYGEITRRVAELVRDARDHLLERLAQRIADTVLDTPPVEAVEVSVRKVRPPIPEDVGATGVRIRRRRGEGPLGGHRAIVALGTNLGDREGYLRLGLDRLGGVVAASQVFETDPVGGPDDQGPYLNMVAIVATDLDPFALLRRCQRIEAAAGRQRRVHWGPRTLDLDLLFYDDVRIDSPELVLPHPHLAERRFVLAPLAEVAPERCPPGWDELLPPAGVHPRGPLHAR